MNAWIDNSNGYRVGDVGFLLEYTWHAKGGKSQMRLSDRPGQANMSGRIIVDGWCGESNNVSVYAYGVARVSRVCKNGRAQVVRLWMNEALKAYESLGYIEENGNDSWCNA